MRKTPNLILATAIALLLLASPAWAQLLGKVVAISDGDTLTVLDDAKVQHKIRLSGIDAPELARPFGQRSKEHLSALVFGKSIEVETGKQDRYKRTLGKIVLDGRDVNLAMVVAGLAWHYKKYEREQSAADRLFYDDAEKEARLAGRGLWKDAWHVTPWEWRAGLR